MHETVPVICEQCNGQGCRECSYSGELLVTITL